MFLQGAKRHRAESEKNGLVDCVKDYEVLQVRAFCPNVA
jgi:hypothetical protein